MKMLRRRRLTFFVSWRLGRQLWRNSKLKWDWANLWTRTCISMSLRWRRRMMMSFWRKVSQIFMGARSPAVAGMPANWDWLGGHAGKLSLAGRWPCRQIFFTFFFFVFFDLGRYNYNSDFFRRYVTWRCLTIVPCANSRPRYRLTLCAVPVRR